MEKYSLPSGTGYYNLDILLQFSNINIDIVSFLYEPHAYSFTSQEEGFYHLTFFKDGKTTFQYQDQVHMIHPGTFVLMSPNKIRTETFQEENLTKYHIIFNIKKKFSKQKLLIKYHDESEAISHSILNTDEYCIAKSTTENLEPIFQQIISELEKSRFGHNYMLSFLFSQIFTEYSRSYWSDNFQYKDYLISDSIDLLSYNIVGTLEIKFMDISLRSLAQEYMMSERQIERHVQKLTGMSFIQKLNKMKMNTAKKLLSTTQMKVAEVAIESGYKTTQNFIKIFKKYEGISPTEYRKSHANLTTELP